MNVTVWDITLIEFLVKFCDRTKSELKLRFNVLDSDHTSGDMMVGKTILIDVATYVPDMLRQCIVKKINAEAGYIVITLSICISDLQLDELINKGYVFESDKKYW